MRKRRPRTNCALPIGFWGSEETDQPNLSFSAEAINGTDGCNRLSGSWTQEETGRIRFEDVASTRMYCDWVNTWLAELDSAVIDNDELHVFNASGVEMPGYPHLCGPGPMPSPNRLLGSPHD